MKTKWYRLIVFFLLLSCAEQIEFDFQSRGTFLVIDGFITDLPGPHTVTVSETIPFGNDVRSIIPGITNATVSVIDDAGGIEPLIHTVQ